jgi:hypothetical protein
MLAAAATATALGGCAASPEFRALRAERIRTTEEATEVKVFLELRNPNDAPVELTTWDYTFTVGDRTAYSGPWVASLTLPPKQVMVTEVPAVVPASFGDVTAGKWRIGGSVGYRATGKLDRLLYQLGINRLTALFGVSGEGIELARAAPAAAAVPAVPAAPAAPAPPPAPAAEAPKAEPPATPAP